MTLQEIAEMDRDFLTPAEVASAIGCDPQSIRVMARKAPEKLGFPVAVIGCRVKIPRRPFLRWAGFEA